MGGPFLITQLCNMHGNYRKGKYTGETKINYQKNKMNYVVHTWFILTSLYWDRMTNDFSWEVMSTTSSLSDLWCNDRNYENKFFEFHKPYEIKNLCYLGDINTWRWYLALGWDVNHLIPPDCSIRWHLKKFIYCNALKVHISCLLTLLTTSHGVATSLEKGCWLSHPSWLVAAIIFKKLKKNIYHNSLKFINHVYLPHPSQSIGAMTFKNEKKNLL